MTHDSYIKMTSSKTLQLCEATIDGVTKDRETDKERYINSFVEERNRRFFHKLFKAKDWTYDRVKKYILNAYKNNNPYRGDFYPWGYSKACSLYGNNMKAAKRLKAAAPESSGLIILSTIDYGLINKYPLVV